MGLLIFRTDHYRNPMSLLHDYSVKCGNRYVYGISQSRRLWYQNGKKKNESERGQEDAHVHIIKATVNVTSQ